MISSRDQYLRLTNVDELKENKEVLAIKKMIVKSSDISLALRQKLISLPCKHKSEFIAALISHDLELLIALQGFFKEHHVEVTVELIKKMIELDAKEWQRGEYLSESVKWMITQCVSGETKDVNPVIRLVVLQNAMEEIQNFDPKLKRDILASTKLLSSAEEKTIQFDFISDPKRKKVITPLDYYISVMDCHVSLDTDHGVRNLKYNINAAFSDEKSMLRTDFYQLPRIEKAKIVAAFIRNDSRKISRLLFSTIQKYLPKVDREILGKIAEITEFVELEKEYYISSTARRIIVGLIDPVGHKQNRMEVILLFRSAMEMIPEDEVSVSVKWKIVRNLNKKIADNVEGYVYIPKCKNLKVSKTSGDISKSEYETIIKSNLDISGFILVTLGLLQKLCNHRPDILGDLYDIGLIYHDLNYPEAIRLIKNFVLKYKKILDEDFISHILVKVQALGSLELDLNKNYSRRFYENRAIMMELDRINVDAFNKVSKDRVGIAANNREEMDHMSLLLENIDSMSMDALTKKLYACSERSMKRDKMGRENFVGAKNEVYGEVCESVFSRNSGVLLANQPNYQDEITEHDLRNCTVDKNRAVGREYPDNKDSFGVYVSSTSGHAYLLAAVLIEYAQKHRLDPTLNENINHYAKAYLLSMARRGFHSYSEMTEIFEEDAVKREFELLNVTIDVDFDMSTIETSIKDAQEYAKTLALKNATLIEIASLGSKYRDQKHQSSGRSYGMFAPLSGKIPEFKKYHETKEEVQAIIESKQSRIKQQDHDQVALSALPLLFLHGKLVNYFKTSDEGLRVCDLFLDKIAEIDGEADTDTDALNLLAELKINLEGRIGKTPRRFVEIFSDKKNTRPSVTTSFMMIDRCIHKIETGDNEYDLDPIKEKLLDFLQDLSDFYSTSVNISALKEAHRVFADTIRARTFWDPQWLRRYLQYMYESSLQFARPREFESLDSMWKVLLKKIDMQDFVLEKPMFDSWILI